MKKMGAILTGGFLCLVLFADMQNPDKPLKGEWNFRPQKVWEVDSVNDMAFQRPSELRATHDEVLCFHDFDRKISYVFDQDGKFIHSFARQGIKPGDVDRYINCFIAGDRIVVGTPGRLHFYSKKGIFLESFENDLFMRFPLVFIDENEFLFTPQEMGQPQGEVVKIAGLDLRTQQVKVFAEFSVPSEGKSGPAGPPVVVLGLTPQVKVEFDPGAKRLFFGRSDNYTIHAAETSGKKLFSFGLDRARKKTTDEAKRRHFAQSSIPKDRIDKIIPTLPSRLTHFMRIQTNGGLIYVFATESLDRRQEKIALDIFSPEGEYLYRSFLRFSEETPLSTHTEKVIIRGNHCYALLEDGSGKIIFAKYKISLPSSR